MFEAVYVEDDPRRTRASINGSNVLFMDGHVEYIKNPGKFPVQPGTAELIQPPPSPLAD